MDILIDCLVEFIMEILPEWIAAVIGVNPIKLIEKRVHNRIVRNVLMVVVAVLCLILGVLITVGIVLGIGYLVAKFMGLI